MTQPEPALFTPYFNLELFLQSCGEARLPGQELDALLQLWEDWAAELRTRRVNAGDRTFLAVWLDEAVEKAVDDAWAASPSQGYRLHALALTLAMCAVQEYVPETEDMGCAPLPRPLPELAAALVAEGLPCKIEEGLILGRRYAVVTAAPFRGGCESCALQKNCPRAARRKACSKARLR